MTGQNRTAGESLSSLERDQKENHHAGHDEEGVGLDVAALREAEGAAHQIGGAGDAAHAEARADCIKP